MTFSTVFKAKRRELGSQPRPSVLAGDVLKRVSGNLFQHVRSLHKENSASRPLHYHQRVAHDDVQVARFQYNLGGPERPSASFAKGKRSRAPTLVLDLQNFAARMHFGAPAALRESWAASTNLSLAAHPRGDRNRPTGGCPIPAHPPVQTRSLAGLSRVCGGMVHLPSRAALGR